MYSPAVYEILESARQITIAKKRKIIESIDILQALLERKNDLIVKILTELKISVNDLISEIQKESKTSLLGGIFKTTNEKKDLGFETKTKIFFDSASKISLELKDSAITPIHLFLAFLKEQHTDGTIKDLCAKFSLNYEIVKKIYQTILSSLGSKTPYIDKFGNDLTLKAKNNLLDPVIGRFEEIEKIIHILCQRRKNNPVLYGEAGVGKTAIVEGLAQKIVKNEVPERLQGKKIIELSLNSLIAGAAKRGEYEERLEKVINEVKAQNGNIILFIDEIHGIIKNELNSEAANILKPALARGEIQAIGATTIKEYHQYFEKDAAFERRFQPVFIAEPHLEECLFILQGIKKKYEEFHHLSIDDEILYQAILLSQRYLTNRFLPDKALDLIDEAASYTLAPLIAEQKKVESLDQIENFYNRKLEAARKSDHQNEINNFSQKIAQIQTEKNDLRNQLQNHTTQKSLNLEAIKIVTSRKANIPLSFLLETRDERLNRIKECISKKVIGQNEAIQKVADSLLRNYVGLKKKDRPIGSFIFMGPTGVGKTELAEVLALELFGSKEALVRFDMSEFGEKESRSKLIGAPPGYIGYEEGGQLTEIIRTKPYAVILFDEIEKAHPEIFMLLLQVLDEGHLTDNQGHHVDFKNTIIICTSNIGQDKLNNQKITQLSKSGKKALLVLTLQQFLKLELINRFDELIYFNSLNLEDINKIVDLLLTETIAALNEKKISLDISPEAKSALATIGYDPLLGARPLKYTIQEEIETPIAKLIATQPVIEGCKIICEYKNQQFVFTPVSSKLASA